MVNSPVCSSDCRYQSQLFSFIESHENTIGGIVLSYLNKMEIQKNIFVVLSHSLLFESIATMTTSAAEKSRNVKKGPLGIFGASSNRRWRSTMSLTSTSSVMSSWRSGRGQLVKLWWTPCPRGLRQCWKTTVATQNIDTLGLIWTCSLRGVLTFVASGLDINGCVLF